MSDERDWEDRYEQEYFTREAMRVYGGSFVRALADAAECADPCNLAKLKAAFPEVWEQYRRMAKLPRRGVAP
jgi:hypothetical protein